MRINKHDTQGTKPLLGKGELGYDDYTAGGDTGRVYVGKGDANVALAKKSEVDTKVDKVTSIDNAIVRFDGTTGNVQNSNVVIDDNNNINTSGIITSTGGFIGNATSATKLQTARTISLTGDVTGSVSFDGSANANITATIAANSVALGTDTTGDYVAGNTAGTGITISGTAGEGWSPTISITNVGTAGTYTKVTTNAQGQVTSGTTLSASDIPSLDASKITSGIIDAARLPAYVDDVLEFTNLAAFPVTGETGKIYVALDTNKTYRWSGSAYVYITSGAVDSVNGQTGVVNVTTITGNAGTATKLQTARTINGVSFDGSANISVNTNNSEIIKFDSGTTEGTDLYTFNGSSAKTIDIKAGTNVTLTKAAGSITISANDTSVAWSEITSKPTTLSGYGITDAAPSSHVGATGTAHGNATTSVAGFMSNTDKTKLDGIATGANNYVHPTSGVASGSYAKVTVDANGHVTAGLIPTMEDIPDATFKRSVRCATTANITLSGTQTIDGIAVVAGDRVLVKEQSTSSQNGIYVVAAGAWTRALDADTSSKIASALVAVDSGTLLGGKLFDNDFKTTDTLGTTALTWNTNLDDGSLLTAGSTAIGMVKYNGTTSAAGQFDGGTTTPTGTTRLNYGGNLYPTNINLTGSGDTTTASSHVFVETGSDGFVRPKTLANFKTEMFASPTLVTPTITGKMVNNYLSLNRETAVASGIEWYSSTTANAWIDYMGNAGVAGQGPKGNITPPAGTLVTTWARRNYIENLAGYGWTFESGTILGTTPTVVAEIRSSDGAARFGGTVTAPTFVGSLTGNASTATTLQTARTINGVSFNGSANINIEDRLGSAIASAATTTVGTAGLGDYMHITGTTTITSFGTASAPGVRRTLIFDGALQITHNATSLICPGADNIVTIAGTVIEVVSETTANWRVVSITHPSVSMVELGYVDGVTSNIQTQLNNLVTLNTTQSISGEKTFNNPVKIKSNQNAAVISTTELVTNGTFTGNATGWTLGTNWAYSNNAVVVTLNGSTEGTLSINVNVVSGKSYVLTWNQTHSVANNGSITPSLGTAVSSIMSSAVTTVNANQVIIKADATGSLPLTFTVTDIESTGIITIDNISLKEITAITPDVEIISDPANPIAKVEMRTVWNGTLPASIGIGLNALRSNTTGYHNTANGLSALENNTTGSYNTANGAEALRFNTTGDSNTANGQAALYSNTTGRYNTATGVSALRRNTTGYNNTANGVEALHSNTTGYNNTATGVSALGFNTTGYNNIANGTGALRFNTTGYSNTANGVEALRFNTTGYYNTANGHVALHSNTTGYSNTANGVSALENNTTGYYNTANGHAALYSNTTGSYNTANGVSALGNNTTFSNVSGFGYNAQVTGSNQVQLGDSATTTYVYGTVANRSDLRDKADVRDTILGLEFIESLRPVDYKWDMREDYKPERPDIEMPSKPTFNEQEPEADVENYDELIVKYNESKEAYDIELLEYETKKAEYDDVMDQWLENCKLANIVRDGSKKRKRYHHGFIAQEVKDLGVDFGGLQDHSMYDGDDVMTIGYDEMIAPLVKAVQELSARVKELESNNS